MATVGGVWERRYVGGQAYWGSVFLSFGVTNERSTKKRKNYSSNSNTTNNEKEVYATEGSSRGGGE
jgi:hypothetical protein